MSKILNFVYLPSKQLSQIELLHKEQSRQSFFSLMKSLVSNLCSIYRLLNLYCEIFGTSSYGEGRTSLQVRLRHMNECQIFHNINSITFLSYAFHINLLVSLVLST